MGVAASTRMTACRQNEVGGSEGTASVLDAALDAIGRAAVVVDDGGNIVEANSIARTVLANGEDPLRATLCTAVRAGGVANADWAVTSVAANGYPVHLIVARSRNLGVAERLARAGREWQLTRRQRDVLEKIAYGNPNKVIAAALGVSFRTVEEHMTALFVKARVESRVELLVKLLAME